jgi:hypothetical protein
MVAVGSGATAVAGAVETGGTLRDNGQHPVEEWLRVASTVVFNRTELLVRGAVICASWQTRGGRP